MSKRAPLTRAEKQIIAEKKAAGLSLGQISEELGCSLETTRKWWRNGRDGQTVRPRGRPKRGALSTYSPSVSEKAVEIKKAHPHWGPEMVNLELKKVLSLGEKGLPSTSRLSVFFKERCQEAVQPHEPRMLPPPEVKVSTVHQRWQMDAKEGIQVGAERVNVQEIRDIYSGLMIASQAFVTTTPKYWRRLSLAEHQQALRRAFSQWGLPSELQTDNDGEFINLQDRSFPSRFTLWLVGLGITHVLSRPHRPTDQPQVERNHRTQGDFVWKDQVFDHIEPLQQALDHHCQLYNEHYPSHAAHCHGVPPLLVFPTARTTGRPYHPDLEWNMLDLDRVDAFLAQFVWTRKVAKNGTVYLGDQYYYLDYQRKSQSISICFLPASRSFRFQDANGSQIKDLPVLGFEKDHLIGSIPAHLPLPFGFQYAFPW
jgi:transposase-like protein/transposase InsO family protein